MALTAGNLLFKKGLSTKLPSTKTNGVWYFTIDNGLLHIDYADESNVVQRKTINAANANTLGGASFENAITNSSTKIPSSGAVYAALNNKMDKAYPTGTGVFTMNSGAFSVAENGNVSIKGNSSNASPEVSFKDEARIVYDSSKNAFNFIFV